jgi:tRNA pseudouridine38-40 synthase
MHIKADRFVYGMVRCLAGAMLEYARGVRTLKDLSDSLEAMDRTMTSPLATPKGLVLEKVYYREEVL